MLKWIIYLMITSMIFFPEKNFFETPDMYGFKWEVVYINVEEGVETYNWYIKAPEEKGVILLFHGNAGNISSRLFKAKGWIDRGYSVFLASYRGYGKSTGEIKTENDLVKDAKKDLEWLTDKKSYNLGDIVFYGESLGTYPALYLGSENKVKAVILEAPYTSFIDLAPKHYPFFPKFIINALLENFKFLNKEKIKLQKNPIFIIHGTSDEVCPYSMGEALFEAASVEKEMFLIPGGSHSNLSDVAGEEFWQKPYQFLSKC